MTPLEINEVSTGEVRSTRGGMLVASGIGSCIAVVAFDPPSGTGAIAHVMLPGAMPRDKGAEPLRYARNAIDELLRQLEGHGVDRRNLCISTAGGGNVLQRPDDTICSSNIESVLSILEEQGLSVLARDLGGMRRRRVVLDTRAGCVRCAVGDDKETVLWSWPAHVC